MTSTQPPNLVATPRSAETHRPSFAEALRYWHQLGWTSFGGPAAQIGMMHRELVERRRWIDEDQFLTGLNLCMLLPGPEAQQLAVYLGTLLHGRRGGLAAGLLFIVPGILILYSLSLLYVWQGATQEFVAILRGLQPIVIAIVAASAWRLAVRVLITPSLGLMTLATVIAMHAFSVPLPVVLLAAGLGGVMIGKYQPHWLGNPTPVAASITPPDPHHTGLTLGAGLILWWLPIGIAGLALGFNALVVRLGLFFSKVAVITFGGAYAVLPYVATELVEKYKVLSLDATMAGLAFAESTPGPLIMVLQFFGFVAGWNHATAHPWLGATAAAAMTTWVTFVPCFLWIFLLTPHVGRLQRLRYLQYALRAVTASSVGVILMLALWLARHVLLPDAMRVDWLSVLVALLAFRSLQTTKIGLLPLLGTGALLGVLRILL